MVFIELPLFSKHAPFTDEALRELQSVLIHDPLSGVLIPGGRGLRKLRVALPGRGKRGGARVIYYFWSARDWCYLVFAYPKSERADLDRRQLRMLADAIEKELGDE